MTTVAVIPARYASTRFPGKPLAKETGKYLVQHVFESVRACGRIDRVIVATDDDRILKAVESFGGEAQMTSDQHRTGTDRVGEVADRLNLADSDLVLNVQGDEPEISSSALDRLIDLMESAEPSCRIGTLATRFPDDGPREGSGSPADPNCVKVVVGANGRALYFSRSLVPYPRGSGGKVEQPSQWLLHLGVYAFRADTLRSIVAGKLPQSALERAESLEQLRWMENGLSIAVATVAHRVIGVDSPEDYAAFVQSCRSGAVGNEAKVG